jgi:hypothetical protein
MSKKIFEVIAVQDRWIKAVGGRIKAEDGYVVHRSFQTAESGPEAIDAVKSYHMRPGAKFDSIRAEFVRAA